jgi:hypothetical protein
MSLLDNTFLCLLFHSTAKPPNGSDGKPVARCKDRIDQLVSELEAKHEKILIPTPALTELLVLAGQDYVKYVNEINGRSCFKVIDFDQRAAIQAALMMSSAAASGDKRSGTGAEYQKVKFDRQIVAIGRVNNVKIIYSDDRHIRQYAEECGISVVRVEELRLPPPTQTSFKGMENNVKTTSAENTTPVQGSADRHPAGETGTQAEEKTKK